jgi:serine/threonine protein kinase
MGNLCNKKKIKNINTVEETNTNNSMIIKNDNKLKEISNQISINANIFKNEMHFSHFPEDYEDQELLGNGGFGVVQKVKHRMTNEIRAMKIINGKELTQNVYGGKHLIREIRILKKLVFLLM